VVVLPVMVIVPVAVAAALLVNEKLPLPVVGVRLLIVRLVIEPSSRNVSASVPGSFGSPSPKAFGVGVGPAAGATRRERDWPATPPGGCSRINVKQPLVAAAVYVPPPSAFPLYDVTVYSPKYTVTMTGVGDGPGVGVVLGVAVGAGVGVTVGVGVGDGVE